MGATVDAGHGRARAWLVGTAVLLAGALAATLGGLGTAEPRPGSARERDGIAPAPLAETAPRRGSGLEVVPAAGVDAGPDAATGTGAATARAEVAPPPGELRARIRRALDGVPERHYAGPVAVQVDDAPAEVLEVENREPVALRLPAGAHRVRFSAVGYERCECSGPFAPSPEPIDVTLHPAGRLRLEIDGLSSPFEGDREFRAAIGGEVVARVAWRDGPAAEVRVPTGSAFAWRAEFVREGAIIVFAGEAPALHDGERRTLRLDVATVPARRLRIVGVSAQLLPHLRVVAAPAADRASELHELVVLPASDGGLAFAAAGDWRFAVDMPDTDVPLVAEGGDTTGAERLRPARPLLGLRLADAGAPVPSRLRFADGRRRAAAPLHVVARDRLGERFELAGERTGTLRFRCGDLPTDVDLVVLDAARAERLAAVTVQCTGDAPADRNGIDLQLVRGDGSVAATARAADTARFDGLEPGRYALRWQIAGTAGDLAATDVAVGPGADVEVRVEWPAFDRWTGVVHGHATAPPERRFLSVGLGAADLPVRRARLAPDGTFALDVPAGGLPAAPELWWATSRVAAQVVRCDALQRRLELRAPDGVRWVDIDVVLPPECDGPWTAMLHRDATRLPWAVVWRDERHPVVVPPGAVLAGTLWTGRGPDARVAAWFEVDGAREHVLLRPAGGRTVTLRATSERTDRYVALVGPRGQLGLAAKLLVAAPLRWFVPDRTRGVLVTFGDDDRRSRELPLPAGGELAID